MEREARRPGRSELTVPFVALAQDLREGLPEQAGLITEGELSQGVVARSVACPQECPAFHEYRPISIGLALPPLVVEI